MGTIIAYLIIISLLVRALVRTGKRSKGRQGEKKVSSRLQALTKKGKFNVLNDVLLRKDSGATSQLDHVVVGEAGVFVIETKNFKGVITGEPGDAEWWQDTGHADSPFENPLCQNRGHIAALKELLGVKFPDLKYHSLAVFPSRHLLHVEDARVVSRKELQGAILSHTVKNISADDIDEITGIIKSANITSRRDRRRHIRDVKKRWK